MTKAEKTIIYGLAVLGGAVVVGAVLSPFASLSVVSPYVKNTQLIKIRGHELLGLAFQKETKTEQASGLPFPIGFEFKLFDPKDSFIESIYTKATGKKLEIM